MPLQPGHVLRDQYEIIRLIGQGGFGFVYQARDIYLRQDVAIKELIPTLLGSQDLLKRFLVEARATMQLSHDRIVRTHTVFPADQNYYIAMEYMAGGSLEQRLAAATRTGQPVCLAVEEGVAVARQITEALAYAHGRGIIHCDLKPANILFTGDLSAPLGIGGAAKLADFGIAHVSDQTMTRTWHTAAGFMAGTLPYMSPEQVDGVRDDPRIDLYAVGAILYRILTGRPYLDFDPRDTGRAHMENLQRIYGEDPRPPSTYRPEIPAWLDAVILKTLAKVTGERYQSANDLLANLMAAAPPPDIAQAVQPVTAPSELATAGAARAPRKPPEALSSAEVDRTRPRQPEGEADLARVRPPELQQPPGWQRIGIEMVRIPAGEFLYGEDKQRVYLHEYSIARTPVTNAQYRAFVEASGHLLPEHWADGRIPVGKEDHPVVNVTWNDAATFCGWAGGRLPTEQEWEKAARGADGREFPWGNRWDSQPTNTREARIRGTTPVGRYPGSASPYGLLDMAGNVWEWCQDDPAEEGSHVLRGGSFNCDPVLARCAAGVRGQYGHYLADVGFRVVADPAAAEQ